jgi:hypothetical protein
MLTTPQICLLQRSLPHCRAHTMGISPPIHSMVRSHRLRCSTGPAAAASAESRYRIATSPTRASSDSTSAVRTTTTAHCSDGWDLRRSACRADTPVHRRMSAITFFTRMAGVLCHTTTLSSEVPERFARQTHAARV